jgi:hypothetical protein
MDRGSIGPVTPDGVAGGLVSPDGAWFLASPSGQPEALYPVSGNGPRAIPGLTAADEAVQWDPDGRFAYFRRDFQPEDPDAISVFRIDLTTGHRELWAHLFPQEFARAANLLPIAIAPDRRSPIRIFATLTICTSWSGLDPRSCRCSQTLFRNELRRISVMQAQEVRRVEYMSSVNPNCKIGIAGTTDATSRHPVRLQIFSGFLSGLTLGRHWLLRRSPSLSIATSTTASVSALARSLSQTKSQGAVLDRILELIEGKTLGEIIPAGWLVLDRMFELGIPCRTGSALPTSMSSRLLWGGIPAPATLIASSGSES